jgi:hypothetical protein
MKSPKATKSECQCDGKCCGHRPSQGSSGGAVYGLGLVGALVYYWPLATSFSDHLLALGKAIVWPALVVYHVLNFLAL